MGMNQGIQIVRISYFNNVFPTAVTIDAELM
jgi:hypothetical protein